MPCLVGCLAFFMPRVALVLVALASDYLHRAYESGLWPCLGFLFLPTTTLAYAFAVNAGGGVQGGYVVLVVIAVLIDLGVVGGGARGARGGFDDD